MWSALREILEVNPTAESRLRDETIGWPVYWWRDGETIKFWPSPSKGLKIFELKEFEQKQ